MLSTPVVLIVIVAVFVAGRRSQRAAQARANYFAFRGRMGDSLRTWFKNRLVVVVLLAAIALLGYAELQ
ncbi:hypothetical protein ACQEU3_40410 [Spirillospora sp. CA-253888]